MRVLLASDFYPPLIGGLERHVHSLARALVSHGHLVEVVAAGAQPVSEEVDGVRVTRVPPLPSLLQRAAYREESRPFHPPRPSASVVRTLKERIVAFRPDVVHAHGWIFHSAAEAAGSDGIPLVATLHDYGLVCARRTLFRDGRQTCTTIGRGCVSCAWGMYGVKAPPLVWMVSAGAHRTARVARFLAVSDEVARAHRGTCEDAALETVPNFIPGPPEGPADHPQLPRRPFILYLGALLPEKGVDVLLQAWSQIQEPSHELVLVGRAHPGHHVDDERATVIRDASRELVAAALRRASALVAPSIWPDPCPTVAMEAMACARPVVATDVGGLRDIVVDEETGLLVPPADAGRLQEALERVMNQPASMQRMGAAGRARFERVYSADVVVPRIIEVYQDVSRPRAASPP